MRCYLTVLDGEWHTGSTLHEYVLPEVTGLWVLGDLRAMLAAGGWRQL